jgi:hypothetical protein
MLGHCPQLADAEWRHTLEGVQEPIEPLRIEPRVAVAQQLGRHREHPHRAGPSASGELGQLAVVGRRHVAADLAKLALDQVEIVEQPFGRRRAHFAAPDIARERAVGGAQHARVVGKAAQQQRRTAAGIAGQRELGGECPCALLEAFDA